MSRPSSGPRKTSQSFILRQHFLRSTTNLAASASCCENASLPGSPSSDTSDRSTPERTLRKKASFWGMFSRGSRKTSSSSVASIHDRGISSPIPGFPSDAVVDVSSLDRVSAITIDKNPPSPRTHLSVSLDTAALACNSNAIVLRSQKSMHTLRSQESTPTLRTAKSSYTHRRPSGMPFDSDSVFSNDSDDVSVSWITSTGRRKVGIDDDEQDAFHIRN